MGMVGTIYTYWVRRCKSGAYDPLPKETEKCSPCKGLGGNSEPDIFVKCEWCDGSGYNNLRRTSYEKQKKSDLQKLAAWNSRDKENA